MNKKILIIEDEKDLNKILKDSLENDEFEVMVAQDGEEGINLFYESKPDLVLLDINLPKMNGWEICKEIRECSTIPIIMMTARDTELDQVKGLSIGADDYITKPFSLKVLTVKIKKILKLDNNSVFAYKDFKFDYKSGELEINGQKQELTRREIQFLEYMIKNKGIICSREQLLNDVWGFEFEGNDRAVDTLVKRLRKKFGTYIEILRTVRGMGYIFDETQI